ncbi:protein of unknown function [bacterium JGI 053]|nr:protein of unknown function [bacterium JGI 053]
MIRDMRQFLAERAELLAFIHLTRREDLIVNRLESADSGVDFLVTLVLGGAPTGRMFGIQVQASEGSATCPRDLHAPGDLPFRDVADVPLPLCRFVFTMADDKGYYGWLKEPVVADRHAPVLRLVEDVRWDELDDEGLARIVGSVNAWYDAQRTPQAA